MYAQIEDPEKPGFYESFTCTVLLDRSYVFVQPANLRIMNYNGARTFKDGSAGVTAKNSLTLNEGD